MYYIGNRYYDPEVGQFLDGNIDSLDPSSIGGLNPYSLGVSNPLQFPANYANIFTSIPLYSDEPSSDGSGENNWLGWFLPSVQLAAGIGLMFIPGAQVFGGMMIAGGAIGLAGQVFGSHIASGLGLGSSGIGAIASGISMLGYGPVGWALGGVSIVAGAGSLAFASAEMQQGLGYGNWMLDAGMDEGWYNGLMLGVGITATASSIAGGIYKNTMHGQRAYAYQNIKKYGYTNTVLKNTPNPYRVVKGNEIRPYTNNLWAQKTIVKYGAMTKDSFGYVFTYDGYRLGVNNAKWLIWHFGASF